MALAPFYTPDRWPGSVRLGNRTFIMLNDDNDLPVTRVVPNTALDPDDQLLDLDFDWPSDLSYATETRKLYANF